MRKLVLVFLLVLLPVQSAWSLVAAYCQAAPGVVIDHDAHEHTAHDGAAVADPQAPVPHGPHDDCSAHPLVYSLAAPEGLSLPGSEPSALPYEGPGAAPDSAPSPRPERPQWSRLA